MLFKNKGSKFEAQVHLGLLAIIFVLILLNFISNYVTYNTRVGEKRVLASGLQVAAVAISRTLPELMPNPSDSALGELKQEYRLSNLIVIPSQPVNPTIEARKKWFVDFVYRLPAGQVPDVARKILGADYNELTRGENDEYFLVYPVPSRGGKYLMILSVNSPELAYLDDSGNKVLATTVISTILIVFTYYLLIRYIFSPFRKLKQQAVESGRIDSLAGNEAEAVAEDYRAAIDELKDKEQKLMELNKQILRKAESLEQFNDYLLQSTNSGVVTIDREGRILSINSSAAELLGIETNDFIGENCERLFETNSEIGRALKAVIDSRKNHAYHETILTDRTGGQKSIGFSVSTVSDDQQQPIGASVILTDLNEIVELRHELESKNRLAALGEMSGGLAHQLRNSIGSMVGFCNLLKKQLGSTNFETEYFEELFNEVKETESLVRKFLGFARPLEYQPEEFDLTALTDEVVTAYGRVGIKSGIEMKHTIRFSGDKMPLSCQGDTILLKQAMNNIIDNAISACSEKEGIIELRLERKNSTVTIVIADNGAGIAEENLAKVFTPFYSSKPSGTGLGLPLAGKIVDLHGGHITVESELGKGTTFRIHLPVRVSVNSPVSA